MTFPTLNSQSSVARTESARRPQNDVWNSANSPADGIAPAASPGVKSSASDPGAGGVSFSRLRRGVFLSCAGFFFVLGALGAFLPGLPATPFLLLTSYFLVRTSPRLNERLLRSRMFGPILVDWQVHGGVRRDVKLKAIAFVAVAVALTIWLTGAALYTSLAVVALAFVGIGVILWLPRARSPEQ